MSTGQADDRCGTAAQCVGQRHHPVGRHPRVGGEAAVPGHAEVVPLHEHPLAGGEVRARALLDDPGQLDPRDEREHAGDAVAGSGDHGVLEVDGGPFDPHEHIARWEIGVRELDHCRSDHLAGLGEQVGREAHLLTVERGPALIRARAGAPGTFGPWPRLRDMGGGPRRSRRATSPAPRSPSPSCCSDGDSLYWLESRPAENGRVVIVRSSAEGLADHSPEGVSVRSRVHEYGGGAMCLVPGALAGCCRLRRAGRATGVVLRRPCRSWPHRSR